MPPLPKRLVCLRCGGGGVGGGGEKGWGVRGCWGGGGEGTEIWYTEVNGRIARVSTAGAVTEFPAPPSGNLPAVITAGPDGAMWFSEYAQLIGRITTSGLYSEFRLDHPSSNACLAAGPDGKVWIAEQGYLAAVSSSGVMKDHPARRCPAAGAWRPRAHSCGSRRATGSEEWPREARSRPSRPRREQRPRRCVSVLTVTSGVTRATPSPAGSVARSAPV